MANPHSENFENAKLCIENGKPALVEKAFTTNTKQASILISLAEEKGVLLVEAMWTRFLPAVRIIKEWIAVGRIGEVECVEAEFSQPISHVDRLQNPNLAGGALLDLGIYSLTFADLFLDGNIIDTKSHCIQFKTGVDASDWVNLTYTSGLEKTGEKIEEGLEKTGEKIDSGVKATKKKIADAVSEEE